jgi:hypothetical protein
VPSSPDLDCNKSNQVRENQILSINRPHVPGGS